MRITNYLGTTKKEVDSKKFNIWIGISLGNKYFTKENIEKYILWALENTKEDILVVIADRIHAINIETLNNYNKLRSFKVAMRLGDQKELEVDEIIKNLPLEKQKLVKLARWKEVTLSKYYDYRVEILFEEFNKKREFYDFIISIVKENQKFRPHTLTIERLEKLSKYILYELPVFLNSTKSGVYRKLRSEKVKKYNLIIYPGINKLDELIMGLQEKTLFPDLAKKLKIDDKIAIVEGYVN